MYKLTALDIDGTLVDDNGVMSARTRKTLLDAMDAGHKVAICTGRPPVGVREIRDALGRDIPIISYHGGLVTDENGAVVYSDTLRQEDKMFLYELAKEYDQTIHIWTLDGKFVTNRVDKFSLKYMDRMGYRGGTIYNCTEDPSLLELPAMKLMWHGEIPDIQSIKGEVHERVKHLPISDYHARPFYIEFVSKHIQKGVALGKLAEHYGIKQSEVIAMGDGDNDIPMIEYAGLGVAMENAPDDVKRYANLIAPTNNDDGVAWVLDKYVLNRG